MDIKRCPRCSESKPTTDFYYIKGKHPRYKAYCKECEREMKRPALREYKRRKYATDKQYRENIIATAKAYARNNPEKARAHAIVAQDIRLGKMERGRCAFCQKDNAQAHHVDYSKPRDVVWLCESHHKLVHLGVIDIKPEMICIGRDVRTKAIRKGRDSKFVSSQVSINNTSGITGVHFHKASSRWEARIGYQGTRIHIGCFEDIEEASYVYTQVSMQLYPTKEHG